ncbi:MAG: hypothetical protein HYZ36_00350 [Pedosphaera parvula]|nr:hypothetical protein [Pedosphaera parvula]
MLRPYIVETAKGNPLIIWVLPHLAIFLVVYVAFMLVAAAVHFKATMYYKYKVPDEWRMSWERMNSSVGVALGAVTGVGHFILYGVIVYSLGYWTIQLESPGKNPKVVRFLNTARESLHSSGFEKLVAAFDPAPDSFYDAADAVGLLYSNPAVGRRFVSYPGTLSLMERPEFQTIITGAPIPSAPGQPGSPEAAAPPPPPEPPPSGGSAPPAAGSGLASQPNLDVLLANPKLQAIFKKKEIIAQINQVDMKDLVEFLKTGKSPKYKDAKVLGRWDLYIPATLIQTKKLHPQTPMGELARLKKLMNAVLTDVTLVIAPDSQIFLKGSLPGATELAEILAAKPPKLPAKPSGIKVLAQGTWKKDGKDYVAVFRGDKGDHSEGLSVLANDNVVTSFKGEGMVFTRSE